MIIGRDAATWDCAHDQLLLGKTLADKHVGRQKPPIPGGQVAGMIIPGMHNIKHIKNQKHLICGNKN